MIEKAMICPQCNAPLTPHRFAKLAVCPYCGTTVHFEEAPLSVALFHKTFAQWNDPVVQGFSSYISIGNNHWALNEKLTEGDFADVYFGMRARWPTELVILKILRNEVDSAFIENEWNILQILHHSTAAGAEIFVDYLPQVIQHGKISGSLHHGQLVSIFRRESGFRYTLAEILQANAQGIPVRASIWLWRRILEQLTFLHASGIAHGAILPQHILIQEGEHGARLIDFSHAGLLGKQLNSTAKENQILYPAWYKKGYPLSQQADLVMSARCMIAALGGNPENGSLPGSVPKPLQEVIQRVASAPENQEGTSKPWMLRDELGEVAQKVFGNPAFVPIDMPS